MCGGIDERRLQSVFNCWIWVIDSREFIILFLILSMSDDDIIKSKINKLKIMHSFEYPLNFLELLLLSCFMVFIWQNLNHS